MKIKEKIKTIIKGGYYNGRVCYIDTMNNKLVSELKKWAEKAEKLEIDEYKNNYTNLRYRGFFANRTKEEIKLDRNCLFNQEFIGHVFTFQFDRAFREGFLIPLGYCKYEDNDLANGTKYKYKNFHYEY